MACKRYSAASFVGKDTERYASMLEVNPWSSKQDLKKAMELRGAIVAAWEYIETTLIELSIRSSYMPEYAALSENYPYRFESRINYMKKVLQTDGPFAPFRDVGFLFLKRFENAATLRNMMAHSKMTVLMGITFVNYTVGKDGVIQQSRRVYQVDELERVTRRATRLSRLVQMGYGAIQDAKFLPPLNRSQVPPTKASGAP